MRIVVLRNRCNLHVDGNLMLEAMLTFIIVYQITREYPMNLHVLLLQRGASDDVDRMEELNFSLKT